MLQDTGDDAMKQAGFDKFIRFSLIAAVGSASTEPAPQQMRGFQCTNG